MFLRPVVHRLTVAPVTLDLADIQPGKVDVAGFTQKLSGYDLARFEGRHVLIRGCAPTWAHLMVAARLIGKVPALDFLIDDGKSGIPVEVYRR